MNEGIIASVLILAMVAVGAIIDPLTRSHWTMILNKEGSAAPWYHGFAWFDFSTGRVVTMPIPLNLLAGAVRDVYLAAQRGACLRRPYSYSDVGQTSYRQPHDFACNSIAPRSAYEFARVCPHCGVRINVGDVHGVGTCTVMLEDGSISQYSHQTQRWTRC